LRPFLEIEGRDQLSVEETMTILDLSDEETSAGAVSSIYTRELGIPADIINEMPLITFTKPPGRFTA
jgi:hypothetical protein